MLIFEGLPQWSEFRVDAVAGSGQMKQNNTDLVADAV